MRWCVTLVVGFVQSVVVILVVTSVVFVVSRSTGDPITILSPPDASPEDTEQLKEAYGLNEPLLKQYLRFMGDATRLDFGRSFRTDQSAFDEVLQRVPKTIQLGGAGLVFSIVFGVATGIFAAVRRGSPVDYVARLLALIGQATPSFWLGLVLIYVFGVKFGWFPTGGSGGIRHLVLPAFTLSLASMAGIMRLTRAGMLDVLQSDFIRTARAKGLGERLVVWRHALRNALLPVITIMGLQVGRLIAGAVVIETVFGWPGLGRLMINSIASADYPVLQAGVIVIAASIVFTNLLVDLTYRFIDPRIRIEAF